MGLTVVIPTLDLTHVPEIPPGADEVILQGGRGPLGLIKNFGALRARGDVLLFLDDDIRLSGDLTRLSGGDWWVPEWADGTGDPYTVSRCAQLNALALLGVAPASIGPFQAVSRRAFRAVGGFRPGAVHEDTDLALRLRRLGVRYSVVPVLATVLRRFSTFGETWDRYSGRSGSPDTYATAPFRRFVASTASAGAASGRSSPRSA